MEWDRMETLTTSVNNLGVELAAMGSTMITLKYASKRMAAVMADVNDYLEWAEWELKEEEMWEGMGIQDEEDAEYG